MKQELIKFKPFPKIKRLFRECVITEKLDGTNASIYIDICNNIGELVSQGYNLVDDQRIDGSDLAIIAASRTRWINRKDDNFGFANWVSANWEELIKLGVGHHFGEWWGKGIRRNYGLREKRFSLFNVSKWGDDSVRPKCCSTVPVLWKGRFDTESAEHWLEMLKIGGSYAVPGYMNPEGIVVYHTHANLCLKYTIDNDDEHKGK